MNGKKSQKTHIEKDVDNKRMQSKERLKNPVRKTRSEGDTNRKGQDIFRC